MKCVEIVYDRILNNLFIKYFNPVQKITLNRNYFQENGMYFLINYTFPGIPESCYDTASKKVSSRKCKTKNESLINIQKIDKKFFNRNNVC